MTTPHVAVAPRGVRVPHLRALREARCLSQKGLAQRSKVSAQAIVRGERGRVLAFATIADLATALGVKPEELYNEEAGGVNNG